MGESLMQPCHAEEGLQVVKYFQLAGKGVAVVAAS